jgi:hypothetical protein
MPSPKRGRDSPEKVYFFKEAVCDCGAKALSWVGCPVQFRSLRPLPIPGSSSWTRHGSLSDSSDGFRVSPVSLGQAPRRNNLKDFAVGALRRSWPQAPWIRRGASTRLLA